MSAVATDLKQAVEDAAAHLYVWALKDIPQDLRDALAEAKDRETSVPGRRVLETIVRNVQVAEDEDNIVCQDTGIAVYTCRVGEHFPLHPSRIYEALKAGTERATLDHPLRSDPHVAKLEEELYELLNQTGVGPMGLGGDVTVLSCHVEHADTHMTLNPVAVNYQCWAARRATAHLSATGEIDYDRDF